MYNVKKYSLPVVEVDINCGGYDRFIIGHLFFV